MEEIDCMCRQTIPSLLSVFVVMYWSSRVPSFCAAVAIAFEISGSRIEWSADEPALEVFLQE